MIDDAEIYFFIFYFLFSLVGMGAYKVGLEPTNYVYVVVISVELYMLGCRVGGVGGLAGGWTSAGSWEKRRRGLVLFCFVLVLFW